MPGTKSIIEGMNSTVKLTKNITIHTYDTIHALQIMKAPNYSKRTNVITEPLPTGKEGDGIYTVPSFEFLGVESINRVSVALRIMSCRKVVLKNGTVVTQVTAVNNIPPRVNTQVCRCY